MSNRITRKDVEAIAQCVYAMSGGRFNHVEIGSKANGIGWKIAHRDPRTGGLSRVVYIGMTASEAHRFLAGMREGMWAAA